MVQRELIHFGLKIIFLFACVLFRVLLGRGVEDSNNEAWFNQKDSMIIDEAELIKDITSELILNENTVCVP